MSASAETLRHDLDLIRQNSIQHAPTLENQIHRLQVRAITYLADAILEVADAIREHNRSTK